MVAMFSCPYCDKQYPNTPALIGRKVRCSACKKIFQLQGDGRVIKVQAVPSAPLLKEKEVAPRKVSEDQERRNITSRQKTQIQEVLTTRIAKSRDALRDATNAAIAQVGSVGMDSRADEQLHNQTAVDLSRMEVRLTSSSTRAEAAYRKNVLYIATFCVVLFCIVSYYVFFAVGGPARVALRQYAKRVESQYFKYPLRLPEYRQRLWVYSRDGNTIPPVILNANDADIGIVQRVNWKHICKICQKHIGGMSLNRQFALWISSDRQAEVERLWDNYRQQDNLSLFLTVLDDRKIAYVDCSALPQILREEGVSESIIYVVSLLLAGTRDVEGHSCLDYGLISSVTAETVEIYELRAPQGMSLIDGGDSYDINTCGPFAGVIVGFLGVWEEEDTWKVMDLRLGRTMEQYYTKEYNPLIQLTNTARRMLSETILVDEEGGREEQGNGNE